MLFRSHGHIKHRQLHEVPGFPPHPEASSSDSSLTKSAGGAFPRQSISTPQYPASRSGFPELEAHLLPSLRDTVDRMTQVNTGIADIPKAGSTRTARRSSPEPRHNGVSFSLGLDDRLVRSQESLIASPRVNDLMTTNSYQIYPDNGTPTLENLTSRFKSPGKSALKSSLKSPGPSSASPRAQDAACSPSIGGSSLKTMKSLLSRKYSQTLKSPFNTSKNREETEVWPKSHSMDESNQVIASLQGMQSHHLPHHSLPRLLPQMGHKLLSCLPTWIEFLLQDKTSSPISQDHALDITMMILLN